MSSDRDDEASLRFPIETLVRRGSEATKTFEYSCHLTRLYPWPGRVNTKRPLNEFGCYWGEVPPRTIADLHSHDEEETLIVESGMGEFTVGGQMTSLGPRDVIYIPRSLPHSIFNPSQTEPLVLFVLYWDVGGASDTNFPVSD